MEKRTPFSPLWIALAGAVLAGFVLRVVNTFYAVKIPFNYMSDSSRYFEWAEANLRGEVLYDVFHQGPLYPWFMSLVFYLTKPSMFHVLIFQAAIGGVNCYLTYLLSTSIFKSRWQGVVSAAVMSFYVPAIFYDGMMLMATLVTFLNLVFLLLLLHAWDNKRIVLWGLAGIVFGLSALARGTILLFIPFLAVAVAVTALSERRNPRDEVATSRLRKSPFLVFLVFLLAASFVIAPVTLRNYFRGNDLVLIAGNFGLGFYCGNNPWATGYYMDPPGLDMLTDFTGKNIAQHLRGVKLKPSEVSSFWVGETMRYIGSDSAAFLLLLAKKLGFFFNRYEIPNAENFYFARQYSPVLRLSFFSFAAVGAFGLLGMLMAMKRGIPGARVPALFLFSHVAALVLFYIIARYRIPVVPILVVFAVYAVFSLWEKATSRNFMDFMAWSGLLLAFLLLVFYPWRDLNRKKDLALSYLNLGILDYAVGKKQQALYDYLMAERTFPEGAAPYVNLGSFYYNEGDHGKAIDYYIKGLNNDPDSALIHLNLGVAYFSGGRMREAKEEVDKVQGKLPYSLALINLRSALGNR